MRRRLLFALGLIAGVAVPLVIGEAIARFRPPADLLPYLGEASPLTDIYRPDPVLGADYRSFDEFQGRFAARLAELGPLDAPQPTWLVFGNSFVHMRGMLGDSLQAARPDLRVFFLRSRQESFPLRIAQFRLMLEHGMRPQRTLFVLVPTELAEFARAPLASVHVTRRGAITQRMRLPPQPWDRIVQRSRLAQVAWVRSGRHVHASIERRKVTEVAPAAARDDMRQLLRAIAELSRRYSVPVTIVALPNREQIFGRAGFGWQRTMLELGREQGLDVIDPREPFLAESDKRALFLPDWHFSELGNRLLVGALLKHFDPARAEASAAPRERSP